MVSWVPEILVRRFRRLYETANVIERLGLFDMTTLSRRGCRIAELLGESVAYHLDWNLPTITSSLSLKNFIVASMIPPAGRGRTTRNWRGFA